MNQPLQDFRKELEAMQRDLLRVMDGYAQKFDIKRDDLWLTAKLSEELGEVMQAYLRVVGRARSEQPKELLKEMLEDEVADLFGMLLIFADKMEVDLPTALQRKWLKHLP